MAARFKLLGCPFCGGRANPYAPNEVIKVVRCEGCNAEGPICTSITKACEAWNIRAGSATESTK